MDGWPASWRSLAFPAMLLRSDLGGPSSATAGQSTRRATSGHSRGGPSWQFPGLQRDLYVIGCVLAGVVLAAGAAGAAVGAYVARRLGWT